MRVVYIHQHFRTPAMSGGTRSYEFARRLVRRGHSVEMITARAEPRGRTRDTWNVTDEAGVRVHWCAVPYSNEMGLRARIAAFTRFAIQATRRARTLPRDVVLASSTPLTVAVPGVIAARSRGVNMVFEVRDVWPEVPIALDVLRNPLARRAALALEAWAYRNAATVIALSPDMATSVSTRFPGVELEVIPNAADTDLFGVVAERDVARFRRQRTWLGDRPLIVYAGTLGAVNNVGYVVELARWLRPLDPDIRVLVVGAGKEREEVVHLAHRRGVLDRNLFLEPPVPKRDMPALLRAADLAISSVAPVKELHANSANKVFDAFAAGCPVLINHGGWLRDVLEESGAGVSLPATDPRAAAALVAARLRDTRWLDDARAAARRLAAERFDRDQLFDRFEQVLLRAAGEGVPAA